MSEQLPEQPERDPERSSGIVVPDGERAIGAEVRYPGFGALFLIWTAVGAVTSARHIFLPGPYTKPADLAQFLGCIVYLYPWIGLTRVVFRAEARYPLGNGRWVRNLGALVALSVPICLLAAPAMLGAFLALLVAFGAPIWKPPSALFLFGFFPVAQAMFWSSVAGGYVIRTRFRLREQERRAARLALEKSQLEAGLNRAQLDVLRARLNPQRHAARVRKPDVRR